MLKTPGGMPRRRLSPGLPEAQKRKFGLASGLQTQNWKNHNPVQEDDLGGTIARFKINVRARQVDILKAYDHT